MRKRILLVVVLMAALTALVVGSAWAVIPTLATQTLLAGKTIDAGTVTVQYDGSNLIVTYDTTGGWLMLDTHLYVGTSVPTKSAPGQFPYKHVNLGGVTQDIYTIPIGTATGTFYIAAQADVEIDTGEVDLLGNPIFEVEGAWAAGSLIGRNVGRGRGPGNWATYFSVNVPAV